MKKVVIEKDILCRKYITENLTMKECAEVLHTKTHIIKRRLAEFGIKKPTEKFKEVHKTHTNQTEASLKKRKETSLKKYGVDNVSKLKKRRTFWKEANSKEHFTELLDNYGIKYERDYYDYDFRVGNILFKLVPSKNAAKKQKTKQVPGFHCIHIFDWDDEEKVIKTFVLNKERIYARNCRVKYVTKEMAKAFLNENHLQGYANDNIRLGLYYKDALVEIMTFGKPRYNKNYEYEIIRLCSIKNVIGGAERLFAYFVKEFSPRSVISYCDLSKFDGNVYKRLGMKALGGVVPSKHWINLKTGRHITDNLLRSKGFDQLFKTNHGKGHDNEKLMHKHNFVEVYDCGQLTLVKSL